MFKNLKIGVRLGLGFGFAEVGTITPRPQEGNPRPRLFRHARDRAVFDAKGVFIRGFGIIGLFALARVRRDGVDMADQLRRRLLAERAEARD